MEYTVLSVISSDRWGSKEEDIVAIAKDFLNEGDNYYTKKLPKEKGSSVLLSSYSLECREAVMHYISHTLPGYSFTSFVKINLNNDLNPKLRKIVVEIAKEFLCKQEIYRDYDVDDIVLCKSRKVVFPCYNGNYQNCFTAISALIGLFFGLPHLVEDNKFIGFDETFRVLRKSLMNKLPEIDEEKEEDEDLDYWEDDGNRGRNENTPWNDVEYLLWYALYFSGFNFMDAATSTINDGLKTKLNQFNTEFLESKLQLHFTGPHDLIDFIDYGVLRKKMKFSNKKILKSILGFGDKDFMKFISSIRFENKKIAKVIRGLKNGSI